MIREQLARKFGVEFAMTASDNAEMATNQKVIPQPCLHCVSSVVGGTDDGGGEVVSHFIA